MTAHAIHQGEKIKRFRELMGVKQEALALELGDDWNQKKVSLLEAKAEIDPAMLEKVAQALKVPKEAIENFDTEKAINIFSGTFNDHVSLTGGPVGNISYNPIDKILELHKEKEALFERMLKEKDEMIARLEKLFQK